MYIRVMFDFFEIWNPKIRNWLWFEYMKFGNWKQSRKFIKKRKRGSPIPTWAEFPLGRPSLASRSRLVSPPCGPWWPAAPHANPPCQPNCVSPCCSWGATAARGPPVIVSRARLVSASLALSVSSFAWTRACERFTLAYWSHSQRR
jgi:hypothetical protein